MILLIDNYDSFTWNLYHYLGDLGADTEVVRNDALTADDAIALQPEAIVLSPGPCTPNEAGICLELVEKAAGKIPLMGVCLGHQAIGQAFGGKVVRAQQLMHGKTVRHRPPPARACSRACPRPSGRRAITRWWWSAPRCPIVWR